jgi:PAS domain S-box-containing protein
MSSVSLRSVTIKSATTGVLLDELTRSFDAQFTQRAQAAFLIVEGRIVRCNPAAVSLTGHSTDELVGSPFDRLVPMPEREAHRARLELVLGDGPGLATASFELVRRDGLLVHVELELSRGAQPGTMIVIASDRREPTTLLQESESLRRSLFDAANDGIFVCDADGFYVDVNPAGCRMLGYAREELLGRHMRELVLDAQPLRLKSISAGGTLVTERTLRRKDGKSITVEISASKVVGGLLQGIVRDLTERKRAEEALRHATRLDSLGRLAGGVAHDFNNILTVLLSLTRELRERTVDPESLGLVDELAQTTDRAAELTRHLLAFARRQPVDPKVVDVNAELRAVTRLLERVLGTVTLTLVLDPRRLAVRVDPMQLEQVLLNLAANARDAIPGEGTVTVSTSLDESGQGVVITVADTGVGMSSQTLAQLFEPFFTTKANGQGTGLGLATVYGIVTQSHGTVTANSRPGEGSTFTIVLPRVD